MNGIAFFEDFISEPKELFNFLVKEVNWDERMLARKTSSFGQTYNYSQISYPYMPFPEQLKSIIQKISASLDIKPNNCLINYYLDGKSKMGFHSDQTDILAQGTGVAIVSIGETRTLRFRKISNKEEIKDFDLPSGSLLYMTSEVQNIWQHAIPKSETSKGRMSLTFRQLI